ncbi:MAG TPA: hypothetical protein VMT46_07900 [Anaerolineaceae bacterium]|nr:hypothetical protein [Anaerolineaceae bacterium]
MKKMKFLVWFPVLILSSLACSLGSTVGNTVGNTVNNAVGNAVSGGKNAGTVNDLWPDVPKMDGMTKVEVDLPLTARLAFQAFISASSNNEGTMDFIAYQTKAKPEDVTSFYTVERMSQAGWNMPDQAGCQTGDSGQVATQISGMGGGLCFFGKDSGDGKSTYLALFFGQDDKTKETQVFFIRVEAKNPTPTP